MLQLLPPSLNGMMQQPTLSSSELDRSQSLSASQKRIHIMLTKYISTIRSDDFLPRLNQTLQSHLMSSVGDAAGSISADIQGYYASRPELKSYTLGVELDRDLDYTLVLKDGTSITDKDIIRSYFGGGNENIQSTEECTGRSNISGKEVVTTREPIECTAKENSDEVLSSVVATEELLIRAANQSLLADALAALTGSEEVLIPSLQNCNNANEVDRKHPPRLILPGSILSMTSVVEKCHFTIDIQRGRVEAICVLAIVVPDENRRLVLARAILIANFQPHMKKKRQLQYAMQLVKAHHFPHSKTLRDAAISLAKDQDNLQYQSQSCHEEKSTSKSEDSMNKLQRSFSLFYKSNT